MCAEHVRRIQQDAPEGVTGAPLPDNIMVWNAVIFGPPETPFEDGIPAAGGRRADGLAGVFKLVLSFDENYPNKPPHVKFVSKMFHPNGSGGAARAAI